MSNNTTPPVEVPYVLTHISDLLTIPAERLGACLDELRTVLPTMKQLSDEATAEGDTTTLQQRFPNITWIDDGTDDASLRVMQLTEKATGE